MSNFSDDFERANGAIGGSWTNLTGTWEIDSGVAFCAAPSNHNVTVVDTAEADGTTQAVVYSQGSTTVGLCVRAVDANNFLFVYFDGSNLVIASYVAGSFSSLASGATMFSDGNTLKVVTSGTTIEGYVNDALKVSHSTSQFQTATKHGFYSFQSGVVAYDDFSFVGAGVGGGGGGSGTRMEPLGLSLGIA